MNPNDYYPQASAAQMPGYQAAGQAAPSPSELVFRDSVKGDPKVCNHINHILSSALKFTTTPPGRSSGNNETNALAA